MDKKTNKISRSCKIPKMRNNESFEKFVERLTIYELWNIKDLVLKEGRKRKKTGEYAIHYKNNRKNYWASPRGKMVGALKNARLKYPHVKHNITVKELVSKLEKADGVCPLCRKKVGLNKLTLDHAIPPDILEGEGFVYRIDDVQFLCKKCNTSKNQISAYI